MLIKYELKKVFRSRIFICMLVFTLCFNLFVLSENGKNFKSDKSVLTYKTYDEFIDSLQLNSENSLSVSVFANELSNFSKRNIKKTAEDFETMRGIELKADTDRGVMLILNSGASDICIILLLIVVGLIIIVDEKEKKLFHLIRSTRFGTTRTMISKLVTLFIFCVFINIAISASTIAFSSIKYGLGDIYRSVQSVPQLFTAFLKLNIVQFYLLVITIRIIGTFVAGVLVILCCLVCRRAISMMLSVILISAASFSMTYISETSEFNFLKYINPYSLINPYRIFCSYANLNIFGIPVNVIYVYICFMTASAIILFAIVIAYYVKKRPLENSDKKLSYPIFRGKAHSSIRFFEYKKILSLNKAIVILLVFVLLQSYKVYRQESCQSSDEYYYKYYMEMLEGPLTESKEKLLLTEKTKIDEAENQLSILNEQRENEQLSLRDFFQKQEQYSELLNNSEKFERVYNKYLYVKENPNTEFFYDSGYKKLFGISEFGFSLKDSLLLMCVFSLCFCAIYSTEYTSSTYKILGTTKYGICKTRKLKNQIMLILLVLIFFIAYLPELIYIKRFYGFLNLNESLLGIQELSKLGSLPIWSGILILFCIRFLTVALFIPIISAISLKSKSSIITTIVFSLIFILPSAVYAFGNIDFLLYFSVWNLLSGELLYNNSKMIISIIQFVVLSAASFLCSRYIYKKFGKVF